MTQNQFQTKGGNLDCEGQWQKHDDNSVCMYKGHVNKFSYHFNGFLTLKIGSNNGHTFYQTLGVKMLKLSAHIHIFRCSDFAGIIMHKQEDSQFFDWRHLQCIIFQFQGLKMKNDKQHELHSQGRTDTKWLEGSNLAVRKRKIKVSVHKLKHNYKHRSWPSA